MRIFAILSCQYITHTHVNRLYDNNLAAKVGFFIYYLEHPISKSAQETAFPKLNYLFV